jgi:hypothetical protein
MIGKQAFPPPRKRAFPGKCCACGLLWLALLVAAPGSAQAPIRPVAPSLPTLPSGVPVGSRQDPDLPSSDSAEEDRQLRAIMAERQKRVAKDASKILKLSNELNAEVARGNPDSLSPAQLRLVAEIEKLARDLKENLIGASPSSADSQTWLDPRLR